MLVAEVAEAVYSRWLSGALPVGGGGAQSVRALMSPSCTLAAALAVKWRSARLAYDELSESTWS